MGANQEFTNPELRTDIVPEAALTPNYFENAYALLDCCDEPLIQTQIACRSSPDIRSLYSGTLAVEYRYLAPYLVTVDHQVLNMVLTDLIDKPWGYFVFATTPIESLRRFFKRFTKVCLPDGKNVLFRFYDPRVVSRFLNGCQTSELAMFFEKIDKLLFVSSAGCYYVIPSSSVRSAQPSILSKKGFQFRQVHFDMLDEGARSDFIGRIYPELVEKFPDRWQQQHVSRDSQVIRRCIGCARELGFTDEAAAIRFLEVVSIVGDDFGTRPEDHASLRLLRDPQVVASWPSNREFVALKARSLRGS